MTPFSIYLSAPWTYREYAKRVRDALQWAHIPVNARWLDFPNKTTLTSDDLQIEAEHDLEDINASDGLVVLNLEKSEGKAFEQGYAVALGMPVIAIGQPANCVFHHLSWYIWVETVRDAITMIRQLSQERLPSIV